MSDWTPPPGRDRYIVYAFVIILSPKDDSLRLTRQPVTHDTVIQDTWLLWTRLAG